MRNKQFSYQFFSTTQNAWLGMFEAIKNAKRFVYWEVYMFFDDEQGKKFIDLLCEKALAGVDVKLIIDGVGSMEFPRTAQEHLRAAGVEFLWYNPIFGPHFFSKLFQRLWERNHRKVLVVDGSIGFVGGVNISIYHRDWNDLHLQVTGKAARSLLYGFAKTYVKCGGDKKKMRHVFHPRLSGGFQTWRRRISFIIHSPTYESRRRLLRTYYKALDLAKESITLLTPYYAPDADFIRLLERAAARGVRIDLIMPARSDMEFMEIIAKKYFKQMLKLGANIYLSKKMNHGKAVAVDGKFGVVGSINLTHRSFYDSEEAAAMFTDEKMVKELNQILMDWKNEAKPIGQVRQRGGIWNKIKAWVVTKFENYV